MTKKDLLERLDSIKEDLDDLIEEAGDDEEQDGEKRFSCPVHSIFNTSLANIRKMIHAGFFDMFEIGDLIVSDHEDFGPLTWVIIGKNHDKRADGSDGPTLTLQMRDVLPGVYVYDKESKAFPYGHAHYPSSDIRNTLNTTILNGFSDDDRAAMVEVEKVTYTVDSEGSRPETTADKLFLLSSSEVGFSGDYVRPEGEVYEYYFAAKPERRQKVELNDVNTARGWWLRSPNPGIARDARNVYTSGAQYGHSAYYGDGAAAACVIGLSYNRRPTRAA